MEQANVAKNAKYIGYACVVCKKEIEEDERQSIIQLGCVQTWCLLCISIKYPGDKQLARYVQTGGADDLILIRNKIFNNER